MHRNLKLICSRFTQLTDIDSILAIILIIHAYLVSKMKDLTGNICLGCVGGITVGVILVSIIATLLFKFSFTTMDLFKFYGFAMLLGLLVGAIAGWLNCYRQQKQSKAAST